MRKFVVSLLALTCLGGEAWAGPVGPEFLVNSTYHTSQITSTVTGLTSGGFAVAWASNFQDGARLGIYGQVFTAAAAKIGPEFRVNTRTPHAQERPSITGLRDGGFVVTFDSPGSVIGRRYNAAGTAISDPFFVSHKDTRYKGTSSLAKLRYGGFVAAWKAYTYSSNLDVYGRRYDAAGKPTGEEFPVNSHRRRGASGPSAAGLTDGGFVIAWTSGGDGSGNGIYARRLNVAGASVGAAFRVNSFTTGAQIQPAATHLANGGFVIVWSSDGQDGSSYGVYGQRYDAQGQPAGAEFRVNTTTAGNQSGARIAGLKDGGFVVTWTSHPPDSRHSDVYIQRYTAAGATVGGEFRVNSLLVRKHFGSSIAALGSGGFVITWTATNQDGSRNGIYGQLFEP